VGVLASTISPAAQLVATPLAAQTAPQRAAGIRAMLERPPLAS